MSRILTDEEGLAISWRITWVLAYISIAIMGIFAGYILGDKPAEVMRTIWVYGLVFFVVTTIAMRFDYHMCTVWDLVVLVFAGIALGYFALPHLL